MLIQVKCPAKINPFLKIFPTDKTGRHPIEIVYQAIGLFDSLEIESNVEETRITTNCFDLPVNNTLQKILNFAREIFDVPPLKVHLTKRIPIDAGLGGSSSDAAGFLRALALLFPSVFTPSIQLNIAQAVGKTVPFFLHGGRAKGTGYGDIIEPLEDSPSSWICVVKPSLNNSDFKVFKTFSQTNDMIENDFSNSFEETMPPICHEIKKYFLKEQAIHAQLCGSGPAVYGSFLTKEQAQQAALLFVAKGFIETFVVPTITKQESLWISYF